MKKIILFVCLSGYGFALAMEPAQKPKYEKLVIQDKITLHDQNCFSLTYDKANKDLLLQTQLIENTISKNYPFPISQFVPSEHIPKVSIAIKGFAQWNNYILALFVTSVDQKNHLISVTAFQPNTDLNHIHHISPGAISGKLQDVYLAQDQSHNLAITYFLRDKENVRKYRFVVDGTLTTMLQKPFLVSQYSKKQPQPLR